MAQARTTSKRGVAAGAPSAVLAGLVAALQHVAIGMAVIGADGQVIAINRAFGRMLGHERDDTLPDEALAIVDPAERVGDGVPWPRLVAGEIASYERDRRFAHRDGSVRRAGVTISALRDDAGRFIGALTQIQDITAQNAAEAAVRENEARLMALAEQLPVALYRQEPGAAGAFHFVSPVFQQITGLGQVDLSTSFAELLERVHPEDRAAVRAADERAGRTGEPAQVQYRLRGGDGDWIWVDNRTVLMRDDHGRPLAWHGALFDITARVLLEASLRESELQFCRAFEDAAIGKSLGSPDLICLDANVAYCRIVGRPREELVGLPFEALTHPDDLEAYRQQMARLHAGETNAFEIEQRYPRPDRSIVIGRLTVSAVRDEAGEILYDFGQLQDITPSRRLRRRCASNRRAYASWSTICPRRSTGRTRPRTGRLPTSTPASPRSSGWNRTSCPSDSPPSSRASTQTTGSPSSAPRPTRNAPVSRWIWSTGCNAATGNGPGSTTARFWNGTRRGGRTVGPASCSISASASDWKLPCGRARRTYAPSSSRSRRRFIAWSREQMGVSPTPVPASPPSPACLWSGATATWRRSSPGSTQTTSRCCAPRTPPPGVPATPSVSNTACVVTTDPGSGCMIERSCCGMRPVSPWPGTASCSTSPSASGWRRCCGRARNASAQFLRTPASG